MRRLWYLAGLLTAVLSLSLIAMAQQRQALPETPQPQTQSLPDAPAPTRPPLNTAPVNPSDQTQQPKGESSSTDTAAEPENNNAPPVTHDGRIVPSNRAANATSSGYDETKGIIRVNVNAVPVQVTVKDATGRLFPGLTKDNFSVYEDGVKQRITFFTSDPFPVSAAIIIDVGMPEVVLRKIKDTFGALTGAFSQFDELSVYTYSNTVNKQQDYLAALGDTTNRTLTRINQMEGSTAGPAVFNPMTSGPSVNGRVFDPGTQRTQIELAVPKDAMPSTVLNDAIFQAAMDLGRREKARRRVIFVLSDGKEWGSHASYNDVRRVLLTNNVTLYAVQIDVNAIPGYGKVTKLRIPMPAPFDRQQPYGNILPKYANATGGEIFKELTSQGLETAYGSAMEQGRSQYTLVYNTNATASTTYRRIEVRVSGYGPSLKVFARDGYYPAPQNQ